MARKNTQQAPVKCKTCYGFGFIIVTHYFTREEHTETCDACGGTGQQ